MKKSLKKLFISLGLVSLTCGTLFHTIKVGKDSLTTENITPWQQDGMTSRAPLNTIDYTILTDVFNYELKNHEVNIGDFLFKHKTSQNTSTLHSLGWTTFHGESDIEFINWSNRKIPIVVLDTKDDKSFEFDWTKSKPVIKGSFGFESFNTDYPKNLEYFNKVQNKKWRRNWDNVTIPSFGVNIAGEPFKNEYVVNNYDKFHDWSYVSQPYDVNWINQQLTEAYYKKSDSSWSDDREWRYQLVEDKTYKSYNFGWTWSERQYWLGNSALQRIWTEPAGIINPSTTNNYISGVKIQPRLLQKLFFFDWNYLKENNTDNGKIWSSATASKLSKGVMGFSDAFRYLKTISYVTDVLDRINREIIAPNNDGVTFDFRKHSSTLQIANKGSTKSSQAIRQDVDRLVFNHPEWRKLYFKNNEKIHVEALIRKMWALEFPDYDELRFRTNQFFDDPDHKYRDFNQATGTFNDTKFETLLGSFFTGSSINLYHTATLYESIMATLKSYNLVVNVEVDELNPKTLIEINEWGDGKPKDITIWNGEKGEFNFDFINDIGKDFIDKNNLQFRFKDNSFRFVPTTNYHQSNNVFVPANDINDFLRTGIDDGTGRLKWQRLLYRYNAVPIDKLVLDNYLYKPDFYKYFSLKTDKFINDLVYLDNEKIYSAEQEEPVYEYYVNDFVAFQKTDYITGIEGNEEYGVRWNVREIIRKNLNSSLSGHVHKAQGYANRYDLFNKVISGIGIGNLNEFFDFDEDRHFFDDISWKSALATFRLRVDNKHDRYPIFASSHENNTMYAIATIPNWFYPDGTHGDYEAVYNDIINNLFKWKLNSNKEWELDLSFKTMAEIKPRNRMNNKFYPDGWDSNGYFLVKLNVGNQFGSWTPYQDYKLKYTVNNWEDIQDQLIKPPLPVDENSNQVTRPFEHAGVLHFAYAKNKDGTAKFWINKRKKVVEKTFLKTITYYLNDWRLDYKVILDELNLNGTNNKSINFINNIRNWIRYSNKYDKQEIKRLIDLTNQSDNLDIKAQALGWYFENAMLDVQITNYKINNLNNLKKDRIFTYLLDFYGYKWEDIFKRKPVLVNNELTNSYTVVINKDVFSHPQFSMNKFTHNTKIIRDRSNNYIFMNRFDGYDETDKSYLLNIRLPAEFLLQMQENKVVYWPYKWNHINENYDPYNQSSYSYFLSNGATALKAIRGLSQNIPFMTNYIQYASKPNELIKQDLTEEWNTLNLILVTVVPIGSLIVLVAIIMLFSYIFKRRF